MFKDLPSGETHCDLVADAKNRVLDLYNPPFKYDDLSRSIADSKQQLFMTVYGLFYKLKGELIAEALNEYWEKHK